jgi:hypothetical protein
LIVNLEILKAQLEAVRQAASEVIEVFYNPRRHTVAAAAAYFCAMTAQTINWIW